MCFGCRCAALVDTCRQLPATGLHHVQEHDVPVMCTCPCCLSGKRSSGNSTLQKCLLKPSSISLEAVLTLLAVACTIAALAREASSFVLPEGCSTCAGSCHLGAAAEVLHWPRALKTIL